MKFKKRERAMYHFSPGAFLAVTALFLLSFAMATVTVTANAATNFTDIFYTNSFRGAFSWFQHLDWVGMLVQAVISCFSLFGVALLVIRIMTSMLYLSAKGLWEEVDELKSGGESGGDKDIFGLLGMTKSWVQGKAGTGLDAVIGAVLLILPNVKRYSDFGKKASGDFNEDMTISQYMLKIALPTIMTVFFFAMGFNGTLFQALAVTVDFMGNVADKAISVNYTGMVDDLINRGIGYKFAYEAAGTKEGSFKQGLAKDLYGRAVGGLGSLQATQLEAIGKAVESQMEQVSKGIEDSKNITADVKKGLTATDGSADEYWGMIGYSIVVNSNTSQVGDEIIITREDLMTDAGVAKAEGVASQVYHIFFRQTASTSTYFNIGENR